jgi:putative aldouronate transport system substrate-binding protein
MKKGLRLISLLVAVGLILTAVLTGCGSSSQSQTTASTDSKSASAVTTTAAAEPDKPDTSKKVELSMYLLGDPAKDYGTMLTELNNKITSDLNATLKINWIGWGDFDKKYPLVLASGEPIDLMYTANWAFFAQSAQKGAFKPLDELLPKLMPQTWQDEPKEAWKQATINGKIYCVPENYDELETSGFFVRGDLMKKYGISEIKTTADLDNYLISVAKNEKDIYPWMGTANDQSQMSIIGSVAGEGSMGSWVTVDTKTPLVYDRDASAIKIYNKVETPEMKAVYERMYNLAKQGVFSKSVLSNKVSGPDNFKNGKSALCVWNILQFNQMYMDLSKTHPEWDIQYVNALKYGSKAPYINNAVAVPTSSANPERALMLLEKLRNDETYFDLTTYGIQGKHFEKTTDNQIKPLDTAAFAPDGSCPWGWRNEKFYLDYAGSWPKLAETRNWYKSNIKVPQLTGFNYIDENLKTEIANINNLKLQYGVPLELGQIDPAKYLPEYIQKLKAAGIDKVIQEVQKQADAYLAGNK